MSRRKQRRLKARKGNQPVANQTTTYRTIVHRDKSAGTPELYYSVYLAPDNPVEGRSFIEMFVRAFCHKADTPEEADLVVFGGGADVNPVLYDESRHYSTRPDHDRDDQDLALYKLCVEQGIPMFGVCRGAQFLHVMNGGKLFQDIDNHHGAHSMTDNDGTVFTVSSVHHQMCIENPKMEVLGTVFGKTTRRSLNAQVHQAGKIKEVEAFFYRDTGCFGVQGHPEYQGYALFTAWCLTKMQQLFDHNPDFELRSNLRRMRKDLMEQRDNMLSNFFPEHEEIN